jgi:hypothetical protein
LQREGKTDRYSIRHERFQPRSSAAKAVAGHRERTRIECCPPCPQRRF